VQTAPIPGTMPPAMKLLVVEDDTKVARFLTRVLSEEGYAADTCARGADALTQAATGLYNLVILDWMLPDMDGLSVVRELRRRGVQVPVMMLTARGEVSEKVLALDAGADDFVVKPFEVEELAARVRALLRRAVGARRLDLGPLRVDFTERKVSLDGATLDLTSKEYALLLHLAHRIDRVVSRTELIAQVWGSSFDPGSNLVDVHVSRLREKLGDASWMIETQRGVGYRLRTERGA
jgi:DNA-binding response OmpR family regulator